MKKSKAPRKTSPLSNPKASNHANGDNAPAEPVTIVGVGASAGGLEALESFLGHATMGCGLAFVVVQHLDPNYKGMMVELLQRSTVMPVRQIEDRMRVVPNAVYVIPPNRDLSILHGVLHLLDPIAPHGLRLPIDHFFRALADDQQGRSIGVVLSGMGSDGTLGLRAIKEKGGAAFVQSVDSAKFDGMPRSVIEAGLADVVAPAEELASRIATYVQHMPRGSGDSEPASTPLSSTDPDSLEKVLLLLRAQTGHDFSAYKKSTLYRRIERRIGLHQLSGTDDYVHYLRENPHEAGLLFNELLISVTHFFRDPAVWEHIKTDVIPALMAAHPDGCVLRAWSAGCATGEEAYSLAMVFREALDELKPVARYSLQIFASDIQPDVIEQARSGVYPQSIAADVPEERLRRFFVQDEYGYTVSKSVREMVIFAPQNVITDPPFTKLDLLVCRNLLIYLDASLQSRLLPIFHYSLNPGGYLVLGSSETAGQAADLFMLLPGRNRIYQRRDVAVRARLTGFSGSLGRSSVAIGAAQQLSPTTNPPSLQACIEGLLLQQYCPVAVLTASTGDLVYLSGKTGQYLEPAVGKANLNIFAMAREGLAAPLNIAFAQALRSNEIVKLKALEVGSNGGTQFVDVTVHPLSEPAAMRGMVLIVFSSVTPVQAAPAPAIAVNHGLQKATVPGSRLAAVQQELQHAHEELQATREEMQSSQEELKSANEELQSTNEELQSTNEELTTSREEMQSMNEELQTVNHELQARLDELSRTSDDMKNLLNSTDIATLFLDDALRVRRFTPRTASIIKLIPGDAGRLVTDLVTQLDYPAMAEDVREVLRSLVFQEHQVASRDGRWFTARIMPYRTQDNRIDGVVMTFVDITASKKLEAALREALGVLQGATEQVGAPEHEAQLQRLVKTSRAVLENCVAGQAPGRSRS